MGLFLIGTGLNNWDDLTLKALHILKNCNKVYFENYTSIFNDKLERLEAMINKTIIVISRRELEESNEIIYNAAKENACLLVIGDPLAATTHTELVLRARKEGIRTEVIHNTSIINAVSETGLQLYKFGRTISLPFFKPKLLYSVYKHIKENKQLGLHTLILLDIKAEENKFMSIREAINLLFEMEKEFKENLITGNEKWVGCARILQKNQKIKYNYPEKLLKINFGKPPHCLIIPGKLHFLEEEFLNSL